MTRLRAIVAGAAALVLGGLGVGTALYQSMLNEQASCAEWNSDANAFRDAQRYEVAFVAVKAGAEVPKAIGDRLLGDCAQGTCVLKPSLCSSAIEYHYDCGPSVNLGAIGIWRMCSVKAPTYFLGAWNKAAESNPGQFRFLGSFGEAVAKCQAVTTGANCLALFDASARCWLLDDGSTCEAGKLYGPGEGGTKPCPYARIRSPMPCETDRGAGSELTSAARVLTPEEMQ